MKKNEIDIRIILDEEVGLYSIIYKGEIIAECLSFDEIAETTILDIVEGGPNMKYNVISKRTGETVAEVSGIREAYNAVNALESHDVRVDRFEPDNYIIKEVPEG